MNQPKSTEIVNVDQTVDAIAGETLEETRRKEEVERYRNNPGPLCRHAK